MRLVALPLFLFYAACVCTYKTGILNSVKGYHTLAVNRRSTASDRSYAGRRRARRPI